MHIEWDKINSGSVEHPKVFDLAQRLLLHAPRKEGRTWIYEPLDPPRSISSLDDKAEFELVRTEVVRAYCAYTLQLAGRVHPPVNARDKQHSAKITRYLFDRRLDLANYLQFMHEVRGIAFMNVQLCTWGFLAGDGQINQHSVWHLQQLGRARTSVAPSAARAGSGHTVNSFEKPVSISLGELLRRGGFEPTDAEIRTVETVMRSPKTWAPERIKSMATYAREQQSANA